MRNVNKGFVILARTAGKCLRYTLLLPLLNCLSSGIVFADSASQTCQRMIPIIEQKGSRIHFAYTEKVQSGRLSSAINNANMILNRMTARLSPKAIEALNQTRLVIYHCDPSLQSGLKNKQPYALNRYDYLTLLAPKSKCEEFQNAPKTFDGRSWDSTVGAGIALGRVVRKEDGTLRCHVSNAGAICDTTTICDANIASGKQVTHDDPYWEENVLVHEWAHTIMNVALPNGTVREQAILKAIHEQYQIYRQGICRDTSHSYACSNADEMWAEASQAWFHATCRDDPSINIGLSTPAAIRKNLPKLYELLGSVYGFQDRIQPIPVYSGSCGKAKGRN